MAAADAPRARARPTGRRVGDSGTRDAILDAARDLFAQLGYEGASMRAIAAAASVDPALIRHFFTDKEHLFAATMTDRTVIIERLGQALTGPSETWGPRIADAYLTLWDGPETQPILLALVRSAVTSPQAAQLLVDTLGTRLRGLTAAAAPDDARARGLALAASHLLGVAFARTVLRVPPLSTLDHDQLVAEIAPTIQRYLDGTHA